MLLESLILQFPRSSGLLCCAGVRSWWTYAVCLCLPLTASGQTAAAHIRNSGSDFQQTAVKDWKTTENPQLWHLKGIWKVNELCFTLIKYGLFRLVGSVCNTRLLNFSRIRLSDLCDRSQLFLNPLLCCSINTEGRSGATERRHRVCSQYSLQSSSFCCLNRSWIPSRRCWRSCGRNHDGLPLPAAESPVWPDPVFIIPWDVRVAVFQVYSRQRGELHHGFYLMLQGFGGFFLCWNFYLELFFFYLELFEWLKWK